MRLRALALFMAFAGAVEAAPRHLTREFLEGREPLDAPVSMAEFTPRADSQSVPFRFEGRLRLAGQSMLGSINVLTDRFGVAKSIDGLQNLPEFDFEFVQTLDALIPVQ